MNSSPESSVSERAVLALNALTIAAKTYRLYGNFAQPAFDRAIELMEKATSGGPLHIGVGRRSFQVNGDTLAPSESLSSLATDLFDRGVAEILIRSAPEAGELASFAALIGSDLEDVEGGGGAKSFLDARGVVAFSIVRREFEVTDATVATPEAIELSRRIRELLTDQRGLAHEIESGSTPLAAYGKLGELLDEGARLEVDRAELDGSIADTIAAMSPEFRARIVNIAVERLASDDLATTIVGQLSESELSDALSGLAAEIGVEAVLSDAASVAESSRGARSELPMIVARRLLESGESSDAIASALRAISHRLDVDSSEAVGLRREAAEEELDLAELRGEAAGSTPDSDLEVGTTTLRALLKGAEDDQDFEELVLFAEGSVVESGRAGDAEKALAVIEVLVAEANNHQEPARSERLERAVRGAVSAEIVAVLLSLPGDASLAVSRFLKILRERSIPALVEQLAAEEDVGRRKLLIEMLVEVCRHDISFLTASVNDRRWYFVRNLAIILGRIHMPDAVPHLIRLCGHPDPRVRREAVRGAASIGGATAMPALARATTDTEESVRHAAIFGLGIVDSHEAPRLLIEVAGARGRDLRERKEALDSLRLRPEPVSLEFLRKKAAQKWPPTSVTRQLARHAAEVLSRPARRQESGG